MTGSPDRTAESFGSAATGRKAVSLVGLALGLAAAGGCRQPDVCGTASLLVGADLVNLGSFSDMIEPCGVERGAAAAAYPGADRVVLELGLEPSSAPSFDIARWAADELSAQVVTRWKPFRAGAAFDAPDQLVGAATIGRLPDEVAFPLVTGTLSVLDLTGDDQSGYRAEVQWELTYRNGPLGPDQIELIAGGADWVTLRVWDEPWIPPVTGDLPSASGAGGAGGVGGQGGGGQGGGGQGGSGGGSTWFEAPIATATGAHATHVVIRDLDGDGHADLVVGGGGFAVLRGDGTGAFTPVDWGSGPVLPGQVAALAAGDTSGDGAPDLVVATGGMIQVWEQATQQPLAFDEPTLLSTDAVALAVADVDEDGRDDVVAVTASGSLVAHLTSLADPVVVTVEQPLRVVLGDVDGDGDLDVVVGTALGEVQVWLQGPLHDLTAGQIVPLGLVSLQTMDLGAFGPGGALDLLVPATTGEGARLLVGAGDGTFTVGPTFQPSPSPGVSKQLIAGDRDANGALDVVALVAQSPGQGELAFATGLGNGAFAPPETWDAVGPASFGPQALALGDLDGAGAADVVVCAGALVRVYLARP